MEKYKTIKELADEIGVSKTAIHKKIDENFKRKHFTKNGNRFLIDSVGQSIIKSMFIEKNQEEQKLKVSDIDNPDNQQVIDLVSVLNARLIVADKQNENYSKQVDDLKKLLDQQQQLTLQANKQIEQLQSQLLVTYTEESSRESKEEVEQQLSEASKEEIPGLSKKWFQFWK
ncbi:DUF536 domain-containing protein [Enterococcus sp. LJL120]